MCLHFHLRPKALTISIVLACCTIPPTAKGLSKSLPRLLKPGGTIAIWLYSGYNKWYRCSDVYRQVTHRLPSRVLLNLCRVAAPLYYVHRGLLRLPLVGRPVSGALRYLLPMSLHANSEEIRVSIHSIGTRRNTNRSTHMNRSFVGSKAAGWNRCGFLSRPYRFAVAGRREKTRLPCLSKPPSFHVRN